MFCPSCGRQLSDNATFCAGCGQRMGAPQQAAPQYAQPPPPQYAPPPPPAYAPPPQYARPPPPPPAYAPPPQYAQAPPAYAPAYQAHPQFAHVSKAWYLVPLLMGIIGGLIGYFVVKDRNRSMAKKLLIFGIVWNILEGVIYYVVLYALVLSAFSGALG